MNLEKTTARELSPEMVIKHRNELNEKFGVYREIQVDEVSVLEEFRGNLNRLEELSHRLQFMMGEVHGLIVKKS